MLWDTKFDRFHANIYVTIPEGIKAIRTAGSTAAGRRIAPVLID